MFLHSLGIMLAAGLAISDALEKSINTIANPKLKVQFNSLILENVFAAVSEVIANGGKIVANAFISATDERNEL